MGINTSVTNSKSTENVNTRTNYLIMNQDHLIRSGVDPAFGVEQHKIMLFEISTADSDD